MRVVQINGGVFGSTGSIMFGISEQLKINGDKCLCFSPVTVTNRDKDPGYEYEKIGTYNSRRVNVLLDRITGFSGCFSYFVTGKVIKKIKRFSPDIIQLHNIHGGFINAPRLFRFIKKSNISVVWTLHDCWAFTGHCPHYDMISCDKWKTECHACPLYKEYPQSFFDNSRKMFRRKKKWFLDIRNMTIVTPSAWLASQARQSFLGGYPIHTVNNGIDLSVFHPMKSDFRKEHGISDSQKIVLGVAFGWNERKGLDVFEKLSEKLDFDEYKIVLVGVDENTLVNWPDNIIAIRRTQNKTELAKIYSTADVFVNPTREDNFPTVNIEALACGVPVVTFDTGGSGEILDDCCGRIIKKNDINMLVRAVLDICRGKDFIDRKQCVHRAASFNKDDKFAEYVKLYEELIHNERSSKSRI